MALKDFVRFLFSVKQKRVTRHSDLLSSENSLDVFDIENIDEEDALTSLPSPFSRSAKEARAPKQTGVSNSI